MYEIECLTEVCEDIESEDIKTETDVCSPFLGMCYPEAEGCCGPDCDPN